MSSNYTQPITTNPINHNNTQPQGVQPMYDPFTGQPIAQPVMQQQAPVVPPSAELQCLFNRKVVVKGKSYTDDNGKKFPLYQKDKKTGYFLEEQVDIDSGVALEVGDSIVVLDFATLLHNPQLALQKINDLKNYVKAHSGDNNLSYAPVQTATMHPTLGVKIHISAKGHLVGWVAKPSLITSSI